MRLLGLFLLLLSCQHAVAQRRVKLKQGDVLRGTMRNGIRFDKVIGHVVFQQTNTTIYCDSAYFYKSEDRVEAFGKIHIVEGDSVDVTSQNLIYEGRQKVAYLRNNVVFKKKDRATLYTDNLDYYREKGLAYYFNKGKLVDSTNTLTSIKGYYELHSNMASFKGDVTVLNPDYTMNSDTLQYNSKTKVVYFRKKTIVKDTENKTAVYESGIYNTAAKYSHLNQANLESLNHTMTGDTYDLDDQQKIYHVHGHVRMKAKRENSLIIGDEGKNYKKKGISKVYTHAYAARVDDKGDTLFISADTLVSIDHKDKKKERMLAYHHVRIFKLDLQGLADSLVYFPADSLLQLYRNPVLWNTGNQMTADSIKIKTKDEQIDKIYLINNAFVVGQDSLKNFNQIKGRTMTAFFKNKVLDHVIVEGNGESIYYALEEKEFKKDSTSLIKKITLLTGMNRVICSNIRINFKAGKINNITFYVKPDANFYPPSEIDEENTRLKGFEWRGEERPSRKDIGADVAEKKKPEPPKESKKSKRKKSRN